jgi:uncharacterized RDD family membrane protein YckC
MTTPQRLIVAVTILLLTFVAVWVVFFDGPSGLVLTALALCAMLLLAWFSRKWREQTPGRGGMSQH